MKTTNHIPIRRRDGRRSRQWKSVRWRVLIACALILGFASAGTVFAGQSTVPICHITGQGTYNLITIADPAYPSHIAHGDKDVEPFYIDADGDGFGSPLMTIEDCTESPGFVADNTDCDDTRASVKPGATEVPGNGIDDNCDPATPDVDVSTGARGGNKTALGHNELFRLRLRGSEILQIALDRNLDAMAWSD